MKTRALRAAVVLTWGLGAGAAWAAGGDTTGLSLWAFLFLGFGALIVAFQAVPAIILFGAMLRGLLGRRVRSPETTSDAPKGT
jgi:hypothetical protein